MQDLVLLLIQEQAVQLQLGHGLADTPDVIIFKNRDDTNVWATYHQGIGNNEKLVLNTTAAEDEDGSFMNGTLPTSSVFSVGASVNTNGSGDNYVAYCFAEKQGYSKFGSMSVMEVQMVHLFIQALNLLF
jgi:hypothetical protein